VGFLILIFIDASGSPPQKGCFEAAEGTLDLQGEYHGADKDELTVDILHRDSLTMPADELIHLWQGTAHQSA